MTARARKNDSKRNVKQKKKKKHKVKVEKPTVRIKPSQLAPLKEDDDLLSDNKTGNSRKVDCASFFLTKLWALVEDPATNNVVRWDQKDTHAFVIEDLKLFTTETLFKYYTAKWNSFRRQLYFYGFKGCRDKKWSHVNLDHTDPSSINNIKRNKVSTGNKLVNQKQGANTLVPKITGTYGPPPLLPQPMMPFGMMPNFYPRMKSWPKMPFNSLQKMNIAHTFRPPQMMMPRMGISHIMVPPQLKKPTTQINKSLVFPATSPTYSPVMISYMNNGSKTNVNNNKNVFFNKPTTMPTMISPMGMMIQSPVMYSPAQILIPTPTVSKQSIPIVSLPPRKNKSIKSSSLPQVRNIDNVSTENIQPQKRRKIEAIN